jgi:hypothetical protein
VLAQHAIEAAEAGRAHVERYVLQSMAATEKAAAGTPGVAGPLALLRSVYALARLDGGASFQRGQYVTADKARRIQQELWQVRLRM